MVVCLISKILVFHHIFLGNSLLLNVLHTMLLSILLIRYIHFFYLLLFLMLLQIPLLLMAFLLLITFFPCFCPFIFGLFYHISLFSISLALMLLFLLCRFLQDNLYNCLHNYMILLILHLLIHCHKIHT